MRGHISILPALFLSLLSFAVFTHCSVKERREGCPCLLLLDLEGAGPDSLMVRVASGTDFSFADTLAGFPLYRIPVPRAPLRLLCYRGGPLDIPYGEACPPLWMDTALLTGAGEAVRWRPCLHKSYCALRLDVHGESGPLAALPAVRVYGHVCGYQEDGTPREGPFSVDLACPDGVGTVLLPRQRDASLMLDVRWGGVLRTFALGELLHASGYDWTRPDLEDLSLYTDFAATEITLDYPMFQPGPDQETVI